jgi:hypothetical protein
MPHSTQKAKLAVWIPILVTIASLTFNAFQYFDKRAQGETLLAQEETLLAQEETLKNLQIEKGKLELKIAEGEIRKKQADISIDYIVTDFRSIPVRIDHGTTFDKALFDALFDEALLNWLRFLEMALPFETSLQLRESTVYAEIKSYYEDITNHYLTFLLLRNAGKSDATNIRIGFRIGFSDESGEWSDREQEHLLVLNRLEPGHGVMVPIEHYDIQTNEHFGTWLKPTSRLTYFDTFLEENKELRVRQKEPYAAILGPTLRHLD